MKLFKAKKIKYIIIDSLGNKRIKGKATLAEIEKEKKEIAKYNKENKTKLIIKRETK